MKDLHFQFTNGRIRKHADKSYAIVLFVKSNVSHYEFSGL